MVISKKSPLSILIHHRLVNLECLKRRFDHFLFSSFILPVHFIIYNLFYQSLHILHFTIVARSILKDIKN